MYPSAHMLPNIRGTHFNENIHFSNWPGVGMFVRKERGKKMYMAINIVGYARMALRIPSLYFLSNAFFSVLLCAMRPMFLCDFHYFFRVNTKKKKITSPWEPEKFVRNWVVCAVYTFIMPLKSNALLMLFMMKIL